VGGAGAGTGAPAPAAPPPPPAPPAPPAPPVEVQRAALETQQAGLRDSALALDEADGPAAQAAGGGDGRFTWPIVFGVRPPITQRFGCTDVAGEPYSAGCATHRVHTGIDLAARMGTPVYAAASGVVHVYRSDTGYGLHVLVAHGGGWFTLYAHLSRVLASDGDVVHQGDPIGEVGSTGFSTGAHLHFETRFGRQPLDPCTSLGC
jgi:murein DD-endopeptidase MepM/ murein hydrolase activator NlpD